MTPLNKTATVTFAKLISLLNGERHLQLDNSQGSFMPVIIEYLFTTVMADFSVDVYSLSHYYEQNGDLIPDPDMQFATRTTLNGELQIFPMTFQNALKYDEALFQNADNKWQYYKGLQKDLATFANMWLKNIKFQQSLKS